MAQPKHGRRVPRRDEVTEALSPSAISIMTNVFLTLCVAAIAVGLIGLYAHIGMH